MDATKPKDALTLVLEGLGNAFKTIAKALLNLQATVLAGWPWPLSRNNGPNAAEAEAIVSIHDELALHGVEEHQAWFLAGQCVARLRRDKPHLLVDR